MTYKHFQNCKKKFTIEFIHYDLRVMVNMKRFLVFFVYVTLNYLIFKYAR